MDIIKELRKPIEWEFIGNEKDFESHILEHIHDIVECMGLTKVIRIERQKQFRFLSGQIIVDILLMHEDKTLTVFEVKKPNKNNGWTSPHAQMQAIGQLLLYQNIIEETYAKPRLVLIDNKIHERTVMAFAKNYLPITLIEFQKNKIFIPYRAY